jgi:topoisomerase-4 subunit A
MIYRDGPRGVAMMKRFQVTGITRDKEYDLTKGSAGSSVLYFSANPNGESETVTVFLKPLPGLRKLQFDLNFADLAIKGRDVQGNVVTKLPVKKVVVKERGKAAVRSQKIWFDDNVHRLNADEKGTYLGEFLPEDKILYITQSGYYRVTGFDLSTHFDEDIILIEKFDSSRPVSCIYYDADSKSYMVKRFMIESASNNKVLVISEEEGSRMEVVSTDIAPEVEVVFKEKGKRNKKVKLADFIEVKGWKAKGNKLTDDKIKEVNLLPSNEPPRELEAKVKEQMLGGKGGEEPEVKKKTKAEEKPKGKKKGGKGKQGTLF